MAPRLVCMEPDTLRERPGAALRAIREGGVVRAPGWWGAARAQDAVAAVLAARERWLADFAGAQFALGRAWYAHLETGRAAEYFREVRAGDRLVEDVLPGLQDALQDALHAVVGRTVVRRPRWAGAGVHIFPAGGLCARRGGDVHFDHEGLTPAQRTSGSDALSLVLMLGPASDGGGLKLWDVRLGQPERASGDPLEVVSAAGDLVVFDSHRLHQIQPFGGDRPRVSATLHGAEVGARWESWF